MGAYMFREQLALGNLGEEKFLKFMEHQMQKGRIKELRDVRSEAEYQKKDVDFLTIDERGQEVKWEIKTDYYDTGNLFLEMLVNSYRMSENGKVRQARTKKGWLYGSSANYIFYYFAKRNEVLIFHRLSVAQWLDNSIQSKYRKEKKIMPMSALNCSERSDNEIYYGVGMVVPISLLESDLHPMVKRFDTHEFD